MIANLFLILTTLFSAIIAIGWSFPFLLTPLIGLQFYIVTENRVQPFLKKTKLYSSLIRNDEQDGWIVGYPFIGYIYTKEEKRELYLFTTYTYFQKRMSEIERIGQDIRKNNSNKTVYINVYEREGSYSCIYYLRRQFNMDYFNPREYQQTIISDILKKYEEKRTNVSILHGERGIGKSMIPLLLAKELAKKHDQSDEKDLVKYCDTFNPTDPGDSFVILYNKTFPTKTSPLIVVIEEFDTILNKVHNHIILPHKNYPILIRDKPSWNQFFDRVDRIYYPWVIFILTTNVHPSVISEMDSSYIREGRVDGIYEVKK
jgi:hypothetical protein